MARPRNQEARREHIVQAALTAIGEVGLAELKIRDVARVAGVSTGTVHYYFNDLETVVDEVMSLAVERYCVTRSQVVDAPGDTRDRLTAMIMAGVPAGRDDELSVALYQIGVLGRRRPSHTAAFRALFEQQVALYSMLLIAGVNDGAFRRPASVTDAARNLVALEDAYGLHIINGTLTPEEAVRLITGHAADLLDCPSLLTDTIVLA